MAKKIKRSKSKNSVHRLSPDQFRMVGIGLLVVVALIVLVLVKPLFVGKAIETAEGNTIDLRYDSASGKLVLDLVTAELVNGVAFDLKSTDLPCGSLTFISNLGWEYGETSCDSITDPTTDSEVHTYTYGVASVVDSRTGTFTVVEITPAGILPDPLTLTLENVNVYSGSTDLFTGSYESGTFTVETTAPVVLEEEEEETAAEDSAPARAEEPSGPATTSGGGGGSSGGGGLSCKYKWECGEWSVCENGQQQRVCKDLNNCAPTKTFGAKTYPVYVFGPVKPAETQLCEEAVVAEQEQVKPATSTPKVERVSVPLQTRQTSAVVKSESPINKWAVAIGVLAVLGALAGVLVHHFRKPQTLVK